MGEHLRRLHPQGISFLVSATSGNDLGAGLGSRTRVISDKNVTRPHDELDSTYASIGLITPITMVVRLTYLVS